MKVAFVTVLALYYFSAQPSDALPFKIPDFGRWIFPTVGEIWPKPQYQISQPNFFVLRPDNFEFLVTILDFAKSFHVFGSNHFAISDNWRTVRHHRGSSEALLSNHFLPWQSFSSTGATVSRE